VAPPCYRVCKFAAGVGGWASVIGGLSIAYATIPMNKRTGITIGGTTYFMTEGRVVGISRLHFSRIPAHWSGAGPSQGSTKSRQRRNALNGIPFC
jgi:hypothetical protein